MNTKLKSAFAVYAQGERYIEYRKNLIHSLEKYVPGVPIVEINPDHSDSLLLSSVKPEARATFMRLLIPLIDEFREYDRVIWIDADTDITSALFSGILMVETSADGLAAVPDVNQEARAKYMKTVCPEWDRKTYFNTGVLVMDLFKINRQAWQSRILQGLRANAENPFKFHDQDILNSCFEIGSIDMRFNWIWVRGVDPNNSAWMVHYADSVGHQTLDEILALRNKLDGAEKTWRDRCVVVSPRHAFIRPWIRAYFANGNTTPLVIVPGPPGDWRDDDMDYCTAAAKFSGGCILDCAREWSDSRRLAERAVRRNNVGWFTKKSILHAVATRLNPKAWAWIDDDAEVTGNLDECFIAAERSPGFIFTQFYYPNSVDNRHPERMYRSNIDTGDKVCWNSLVFFHGDANRHISEELGKDFPVEDDEIIFGHLYQTKKDWHDGFCDFSIRNWQVNCKLANQIPARWNGKLIHYTTQRANGEVKKIWAAKADTLPKAPFERSETKPVAVAKDDPIDAVFVIGTESIDNNQELRFALRNLAQNCPFVRNVYISGFCPKWVDKSVVRHLEWPDRFQHAKDANIIDKLRHACEQPGIAKRILFCSDDQFQTRICTWEDFAPRYLRRYASNDGWYEKRNRVWHSRLHRTLEREVNRRKAIGMDANDVFYYQPHIWMPIDRDTFIAYARWCGYEHRDDTIIASGYFNFADAAGKPDFDHIFITGSMKDVPSETHVAYYDHSYPSAIAILRKMFPEKCRFERGNGTNGTETKTERTVTRTQTPRRPAPNSTPEDDPSPSRPEETAEITSFIARVRDTPVWHGLLTEISRAEELRLFGVHGWRIVWKDIMARFDAATDNGLNVVPVQGTRSDAASAVITAYAQNPDALRTVRFGVQRPPVERKVWMSRNAQTVKASDEARDSLRDRIRLSLRKQSVL